MFVTYSVFRVMLGTIASLEVLDNLVLCSALPVVCCSLVFPHLCAKPKIA